MVKIVIKLLIEVRDMERGKSPLASSVMIFELVPPGQATNIINPIAIKGSGLKIRHKIKPISGNKII
jgi:hypothetical protein